MFLFFNSSQIVKMNICLYLIHSTFCLVIWNSEDYIIFYFLYASITKNICNFEGQNNNNKKSLTIDLLVVVFRSVVVVFKQYCFLFFYESVLNMAWYDTVSMYHKIPGWLLLKNHTLYFNFHFNTFAFTRTFKCDH